MMDTDKYPRTPGQTATLVELDGSTLEVEGVDPGCESVTMRDKSTPKVVTPEILREAFRFRPVEEILRGPRPSPWAAAPEIVYRRDWAAAGLVFRRVPS